MLRLKNTAIHFPDNSKIDCDLTGKPGKIFTITGPSGVGKSTLLLAIAGFRGFDSGDVLWQEASFAHQAVWDRPLSMLFQSDNLFGHLSAYRNIALSAPKTSKKHEISDKIAQIAQNLDIAQILDKPCSAISGGQQQRVGLARVLLANKPILLLDEPFSALDDDNRHAALQLVKKITKEHQLVTLVVTHDQDDVSALDATSLVLGRKPL